MTKKIFVFIAFITIISGEIKAQQEPHFIQYFDNTLFLNPAYAGSNNMLSMNSIHREQWMGFDGRPSSTTFAIHSPLRYESVGVGISAVRDIIGPTKQNMCFLDFSYTLKFSKKQQLSFGLKSGFNLISTQTSTLSTTEANDPKLQQNTLNNFNPNFGFGIYYHTPSFFLGLSSPKLIESSIDGSLTNLERRHYYGIVGGIINLSSDWKLRPTAQIKSTLGAPLSIDASMTAIYNDNLYLGGMYRWQSAAGVFVQYQINNQFRVGLASEFATSELRNYNNGTFEILLSYDFMFQKGGIRSPRYF